MQVSDFDYELPEGLIAQHPLPNRSASRMLVVDRNSGSLSDRRITDLPEFLGPGDLMVFNNTRVLAARLHGRKATGGRAEILLERVLDGGHALAQIRASKSPRPGSLLEVGDTELEVVGRDGGFFELKCRQGSWAELLDRHGHMPLPPYIDRPDAALDQTRYQTVYAETPGAVAAPTAGLHFDDDLLAATLARGASHAHVTLHVAAGTFQPVRVNRVEDHSMHAEWLQVPQTVVEQVQTTRNRNGRVLAVGTTSVRSLETASRDGQLQAFSGDSRLFIYPGYQFNTVDIMLTNFHLPKSTLMMLVSAFAGTELIREAYTHAVQEQYRFFSYGDAMLIV